MSPRAKAGTIELLRWLVPIVLSIGVAWGTLGATLHGKVGETEFQTYKAHTDDEFQTINTTLQRIDQRTHEMYCAGKPPGCE